MGPGVRLGPQWASAAFIVYLVVHGHYRRRAGRLPGKNWIERAVRLFFQVTY